MVTESRSRLQILPSDRIFFAGRTGSGKTVLARELLSGFKKFVVLDPKHTFKMRGVPYTRHFDKDKPQQIVRVPFFDRKKDKNRNAERLRWADVIDDVWKAGNRILYIDELNLITQPRPILPELDKAIRTGRERGLGVWTASQRPKEIPSGVFTEAEHFFIFDLGFKLDRVKIMHITRDEMWRLTRGLSDHHFAYYDVRKGVGRRFDAIQPRYT